MCAFFILFSLLVWLPLLVCISRFIGMKICLFPVVAEIFKNLGAKKSAIYENFFLFFFKTFWIDRKNIQKKCPATLKKSTVTKNVVEQ